MASVKIINNSAKIKAQMERNISRALSDWGREWEEVVRHEIESQPRFGDIGSLRIVLVCSVYRYDAYRGLAVKRQQLYLLPY